MTTHNQEVDQINSIIYPQFLFNIDSVGGSFNGPADPVEIVNRETLGIDAAPAEVANAYFLWLCSRTGMNGDEPNLKRRTADHTYFMLALKLHSTYFFSLVPHDENLEAHGKNLRGWFSLIGSAFKDYSIIDKPRATVLEVLAALAERIDMALFRAPDMEDQSQRWFWLMLHNLGIDEFCDENWTVESDILVGNALNIWLNRAYGDDGKGSLFPKNSENYLGKEYQKIEIWDQMQNFFRENWSEFR